MVKRLPEVMPRVTLFPKDDMDMFTDRFEVTLDNADAEYRFAFRVEREEYRIDRDVARKRIKKAADTLMADYERDYSSPRKA